MAKMNFLYSPLTEAYSEGGTPLSESELVNGMAQAIQSNQPRLFQEYAVAMIDHLLGRLATLEAARPATSSKAKKAESAEA